MEGTDHSPRNTSSRKPPATTRSSTASTPLRSTPDTNSSTPKTSWTRGHSVPTLCESCNGKGSRWKYVQEYTRWHNLVVTRMRNIAFQRPSYDPFALGETHTIKLPYDVLPRRFVGQAVAMILAAQATYHLWADNPQLVQLIGGDRELHDDAPGPIDMFPCRIYLGLANQDFIVQRQDAIAIKFGDRNRKSPGGLHLPPRASSNTPFQFYVYSPFVVTLMLGNSPPPWRSSTDVTHWTQMDHHQRPAKGDQKLELPAVHLPRSRLLEFQPTTRREEATPEVPLPSRPSGPARPYYHHRISYRDPLVQGSEEPN